MQPLTLIIALAAWLVVDALFVGALVAITQRRERRFRAAADALVDAAERYANGLPPRVPDILAHVWRPGRTA